MSRSNEAGLKPGYLPGFATLSPQCAIARRLGASAGRNATRAMRLAVGASILCCTGLHAAEENGLETISVQPAEKQEPRDYSIEEIVVTGVREDSLDPVGMSEIYNSSGRGGWLYRKGRYEEAFPHLLAAAERGFKLAQARVSYIYQQGLGGVERDAEAAIGWLGVAATPTTTPEIRAYYRRVLAHFPDDYRARIDEIVQFYVNRYGSTATRVDCENTRLAGTFISRLKCDFRDAPNYRDVLDSGDLPSFTPPLGSGP